MSFVTWRLRWPRPLLAVALLTGVTACGATGSYALARQAAQQAIRDEARLDPSRFPERTFAVLPFRAEPGDSIGRTLGWALAELVAQDLARTRKLTVLDRTRVGALLQELALAKRGRTDSLSAPRAGRLLGASWVTVGSLERQRDSGVYKVVVRSVYVPSGSVTPGYDGLIRLDEVSRDEERLTRQVLTSLSLTTAATARATAGTAPIPAEVLLRLGRGVEQVALGQVSEGTATLKTLAREFPTVRAATTAANDTRTHALPATAAVRRDDLLSLSQTVVPLLPIRTAEAVDVAASAVVQLAQLNIFIIVP